MSALQRTAEEVRSDYVEKMGKELGELFHVISDEVTDIHWRWGQYRVLFGDKPSRIDLLNEAAPFFFRIVHDVLFEVTILAIARLVGPTESVGKPNLSIERLIPLLPDNKVQGEVREILRQTRERASFALEYRNRHIAHRDLQLALGKSATMLPTVTRENIDKCLSGLGNFLNAVELFYCKAHTAYSFVVGPWGAESLLYVIRDGLLREKERHECWNRKELHRDDISPLGEI
jgi:hypothetical protein